AAPTAAQRRGVHARSAEPATHVLYAVHRRRRSAPLMTLSRSNPRAQPRWLLLISAVAALVMALATSSLAVHDDGLFELDKTTTNDLNTSKRCELGTSAAVGALSLNVCPTATSAPAAPFTILVEAERMTVPAD